MAVDFSKPNADTTISENLTNTRDMYNALAKMDYAQLSTVTTTPLGTIAYHSTQDRFLIKTGSDTWTPLDLSGIDIGQSGDLLAYIRNASNINAGTLNDARLSGGVTLYRGDISGQNLNIYRNPGIYTIGSFPSATEWQSDNLPLRANGLYRVSGRTYQTAGAVQQHEYFTSTKYYIRGMYYNGSNLVFTAWIDVTKDTTYTAGSGLSLSGTAFSLDVAYSKDLGTSNLNSIKAPGNYRQTTASNATTSRNYPVANNTWSMIVTNSASNGYGHQFIFSLNMLYMRRFSGNSFNSWLILSARPSTSDFTPIDVGGYFSIANNAINSDRLANNSVTSTKLAAGTSIFNKIDLGTDDLNTVTTEGHYTQENIGNSTNSGTNNRHYPVAGKIWHIEVVALNSYIAVQKAINDDGNLWIRRGNSVPGLSSWTWNGWQEK